MGTLYVVRHGQASFLSDDYDQLSNLGEQQGRWLGEYWTQWGVHFDHVFVGPCKRHQQTHDAVASVFHEKGLPWPNPTRLDALDEHKGAELLEHALPDLVAQDPQLQAWMAEFSSGNQGKHNTFQKIFEKVTRMWAKKELNPKGIESWAAFLARVISTQSTLTPHTQTGQKVVAFTSGGPVAVLAGHAFRLDEEQILELSWQIYNAGFAEFLFTDKRFTLRRLNATPHIPNPKGLTYR